MNKAILGVAVLGGLGVMLATSRSKASETSGSDKPIFDQTFSDGSRVVIYAVRKIPGKAGERYRALVAITGGMRDELKVLAASLKEKVKMLSDAGVADLESFDVKEGADGLLVTTVATLLKDQDLMVVRGVLTRGGNTAVSRPVSLDKLAPHMPGEASSPTGVIERVWP